MSVDNGKVWHYAVESKLSGECTSAMNDLGGDLPEFYIWYQGHKDQCTKTHTGSSGSMECSIANKIWKILQYKHMISDGDSKAYSSVWDTYGCCQDCQKWENMDKHSAYYEKWCSQRSMQNGEKVMIVVQPIVHERWKLDLTGHVQKTMGNHLRDLRKKQKKLKEGKSVKGSEHDKLANW